MMIAKSNIGETVIVFPNMAGRMEDANPIIRIKYDTPYISAIFITILNHISFLVLFAGLGGPANSSVTVLIFSGRHTIKRSNNTTTKHNQLPSAISPFRASPEVALPRSPPNTIITSPIINICIFNPVWSTITSPGRHRASPAPRTPCFTTAAIAGRAALP